MSTSPRLLITVDAELSNFQDGQGLWGRVDGQDWGLRRLLDVFSEEGARATVFLDAYGGSDRDLVEQRRAAELVSRRGHDLQLHTHPGPAFDPSRPRLLDYDAAEQEEILALGRDRIAEWSGQRPVLHRAGDWAADERSLAALRRQGFRGDFSACLWSRNCGIEPRSISGNGWTRLDQMLCGVGTCFRDRVTGRIRRLDLASTSSPEVADLLSRAIDPLILTFHSFSLLKYDRKRTHFEPNLGYLDRLRRFFRRARAQRYVLSTALDSVAELESRSDQPMPWSPLPTTSVTASCAGVMKSVLDRVRGK
jgi:peptidoglycan/xylan/chitin deacetylase (PgdA/CDA1 family)